MSPIPGPFDDEMTRSFYQDYPQLRDTLPPKLFESDRSSKQAAVAGAPAPPAPASDTGELEHGTEVSALRWCRCEHVQF
jgi:hypothetical protein